MALEINIRDTGTGISEQGLANLFMDFNKLAENENENKSGTGLGLSICKRIIEQMGGKVSCTSELGQGTEFKIELTLKSQLKKDLYSLENNKSSNKPFVIMRKERDSLELQKFNSEFIQGQLQKKKVLKRRTLQMYKIKEERDD